MRTRPFITALILAVTLAVTGACGKKPIDTIADIGVQLAPVVEEAQRTVTTADSVGQLPKDATAKAQAAFVQAGQVMQKIGAALRVYDTLGTEARTGSAAEIRRMLDDLRSYTRVIMAYAGGNPQLTEQLNRTFTNLDRLIDTIVQGLAPLRAGGN